MINQLVQYAQNLPDNLRGEEGFTSKKIRWLINFNSNGEYLGVIELSQENRPGKGREFKQVPHLRFSGDTPMRQFLVDTAQYALLFGQDSDDQKLKIKHDFFLDLLQSANTVEPFLGIVAAKLKSESILQRICQDLVYQSPAAKTSDNITFAETSHDGTRIIVETNGWHAWWRDFFPTLFKKKPDQVQPMLCYVSGKLESPARTHPKIKGLGGDLGGNIETTLVGFNLNAFCSYGLQQSANAAMTGPMAEQYAAALNHLISHNSHNLAGVKVVYWYVGDVRKEEDPLPLLFDISSFGDVDVKALDPSLEVSGNKARRVGQAESRAAKMLAAIRSGNPEAIRLKSARYCAMTISGNAGRVIVRDWMEGQFEELLANIEAWFEDLSIVSRDGLTVVRNHKFFSLLAAVVRDLKDISKPMVGMLWHAALKRKPIPHQFMAQTLLRIRTDIITGEPARHARYGLLKAYYNRMKGEAIMKEKLNTELDNPAYLCGRIMALLADIQQVAMPNVGAGVIQRYYAAASTTPGLVLGRLVRLAQIGHLPKIESDNLRFWFEKQMAQIWQRLNAAPPAVLDLEGQTLFAMGYYQQKAQRQKSEEKENNN